MHSGSHQDIYVARPKDNLPDFAQPGDVSVGTLVLDKGRESVTSMKLQYIVPPKPNKKDAESNGDSTEKKEKESLEDIVFKAKLTYMAGLRTKDTTLYKEISAALEEERPDSVPLLSELLTYALECPVPSTESDEDKFRAGEINQLYNAMQKTNGGPIDQISLAQYFGLNELDKDELEEDEKAKALDKEMKEKRDFIKKILLTKASLAGKIADKDPSKVDDFDTAVKEMKRWVSIGSAKDEKDKIQLTITLARHARLCQDKKVSACSILLKAKKDLIGNKELKQVDEELAKLYNLFEGAEYLVENLKESIHCRFPVLARSV